jgi:hypothetical protein
MSALGLFSAAPGVSDGYVLGSPLFKHVSIDRRAAPTQASHLEDIVAAVTKAARASASRAAGSTEEIKTEDEYKLGCCLDIVAPAADKDTMLVMNRIALALAYSPLAC